jgi:cytochrome c biogenesis protein
MNESKGKARDKDFFSILFDFFRSLKLTIFLLILLAILSVIGTLIKQNAAPAEYVARIGVGLYEVLDFFNLLDMYHSWWFSAILLLLVINLIACSTQRLPGVWSQMFRSPGPRGLEDSMLRALPYVERIKDTGRMGNRAEADIHSSLEKRFGGVKRIETESAITFFGERGRFSRLGVYITHLSILIILIGGVIGSRYGFIGFMNVLEGETVDQIYLRGKRGDIPTPIGFAVRCDDFSVTFYDLPGQEKYVKDYTSQLTILDDGKEVMRRTIQVNHPLHYKGLAFYQSSYGTLHDITLGVEWKNRKERTLVRALEGETVRIPNSNAMVRVLRFTPQVHNLGEGVQVALFTGNESPRSFWLLKGSSRFGEHGNQDFLLSFEGVTSREYTGLQVAKDPGVGVVWVGCGLMIFGLIVSFFFSHQRVWVRFGKGTFSASRAGEIVLAGSANKNRIAFEKTFQQLVDDIRCLNREASP